MFLNKSKTSQVHRDANRIAGSKSRHAFDGTHFRFKASRKGYKEGFNLLKNVYYRKLFI